MSAPSTVDHFLELTRKSGLLDPQHFQNYLQCRREAGPLPAAPRALADALVRDGLLTRFQAEQLLSGRWRNFILCDKYKILGPLGSGGMGHVFLCQHQVMRRRVAVKILPAAHADNPAALERFHREARAVAQLHHPNIVGGHDVDRDGKLHFLVMEYIDGNTLHKIVKQRGPLSPLRAAHYVRQAALGLQHAHEAGLVHRDIKPSNLLLDRQGTVKILDMGLARFFLDDNDDLSRRHIESTLGTTGYMAPEQALDSHAADARADIYSLGATFYFLLTGREPFQGGTAFEKMMWHQVRPPQPVRELRPEVPEGLAEVLGRMMAKDPAKRYQTPAELAQALALWTQTPIPPPPPEEMPKLLTPARGACPADAMPGSPAFLYGPGSATTPSPAEEEKGTPPSGSRPVSVPIPAASAAPAPPAPPTQGQPADAAPPAVPSRPPEGIRPAPPPSPRKKGGDPRRGLGAGKGRTVWALAGVAAVLLAAAAGGFALLQRKASNGPPPSPSQPTTPPLAAAETSPPLRLLVPAYFYPAEDGLAQWDRLFDSPAAAATLVIVNPNSGPGTAADPNYANVVERARQKGTTVLGYVSTKYAARPLNEVKADVDRWVRFYPGVHGIFFDEQASATEQVPYYASLYQHVRKVSGLSLVVSNPGTACAEEYLARPAADIICLAEVTRDFSAYRPPPWTAQYPTRHFAALLTGVDTSEHMKKCIQGMGERKIGACYVTEGRLPNPWDRLPRYWEAEAAAVQQASERKEP